LQKTQNWEDWLIDQMVGLHQKDHRHQVKEGDPSSLIRSGEVHLKFWVQCRASTTRETRTYFSEAAQK